MVKKAKFDESGDSDDLQALFDSIASTPAVKPAPAPAPAAAPAGGDAADSDDLQALFDSVAAEFTPPAAPAPKPAAAPAVASAAAFAAMETEDGADKIEGVFTRIGQMTRQVHDTLRQLGFDHALQEVAEAIPDARQRLSYIAQMTEQAASRVLNATDIAQPIQERLGANAESLQVKWDRLYANELSVDEFKSLAAETRDFIGGVADGSRQTNAQLMEIMMAQDFQDLTGQVIKKVVDMAQTLESQLLQVLLEITPNEKRTDAHTGLMNGPVINSEGRDDVVTSQEQVDDLLESLGF